MTVGQPDQARNRHPLTQSVLPLLPTSTVGSHAPTAWLITALAAIERGEFGECDVNELLTDAVDIAVLDQQRAGIDILVDGEMQRQDFNLGFYGRFPGLVEQPLPRKLGPEGHDQRGKWLVTEPLSAPDGLGVVREFSYLLSIADRPVKATVPGPFTLAGRLDLGRVYQDRMEAAYALAEIVNRECTALVEAGADFIQIDEPSYAVYPDRPRDFVELFNRAVDGVQAKIGVHMCFGNYRGRPVAKRAYRPLFPHIFDLKADQLVLEFANRELCELELWKEFPNDRELAAGVIDVKNYWCESAADVAQRIREALRYVSPDKLWIVPDCGLSQTARWAALRKLRAMVQGAEIVRHELTA